jgi:hypothetical protein
MSDVEGVPVVRHELSFWRSIEKTHAGFARDEPVARSAGPDLPVPPVLARGVVDGWPYDGNLSGMPRTTR